MELPITRIKLYLLHHGKEPERFFADGISFGLEPVVAALAAAVPLVPVFAPLGPTAHTIDDSTTNLKQQKTDVKTSFLIAILTQTQLGNNQLEFDANQTR